MGTSRSPHELAGKLRSAGTTVDRARVRMVTEMAAAAKVNLLAAPGAPHMVAGGRTNVRYDVTAGDHPTAIVRWTGPAHLVNNPTKAHIMAPKGSEFGKGLRSGKAGVTALYFGGRWAAWSHTFGTKGKHFFETGRDAAERTVPAVGQRSFHRNLTNVFGG